VKRVSSDTPARDWEKREISRALLAARISDVLKTLLAWIEAATANPWELK
jgi:hypothetical protein